MPAKMFSWAASLLITHKTAKRAQGVCRSWGMGQLVLGSLCQSWNRHVLVSNTQGLVEGGGVVKSRREGETHQPHRITLGPPGKCFTHKNNINLEVLRRTFGTKQMLHSMHTLVQKLTKSARNINLQEGEKSVCAPVGRMLHFWTSGCHIENIKVKLKKYVQYSNSWSNSEHISNWTECYSAGPALLQSSTGASFSCQKLKLVKWYLLITQLKWGEAYKTRKNFKQLNILNHRVRSD